MNREFKRYMVEKQRQVVAAVEVEVEVVAEAAIIQQPDQLSHDQQNQVMTMNYVQIQKLMQCLIQLTETHMHSKATIIID